MSRLPELLAELQRRTRRGMVLGLDRMREALASLGDPHCAYPCVHIAGSNGKGSVSAMVEETARRAGLRTGLYTSPHLSRFAERVRIAGVPIEEDALERALLAALEEVPLELTFFEAMTVAAFVAFREAGVQLVVLEVGLGGRLDATNVVEAPCCTAITSIALEHTDILGSTLVDIGREKAGILKRGAPVVLGPLDAAVEAAVTEVAAGVGAGPIVRVRVRGERGGRGERGERGDEIGVTRQGRAARIEGPGGRVVEASLGLAGAHQADNAAVACGIAWQLAERWPAVAEVLPEALTGARWPGRMERLTHAGKQVLLDCAHNPHGAAALAAALADEAPDPGAVTLVFGALADKAWAEMLRLLAPRAARRVYTCPQGRLPAPVQELAAIAPGDALTDPRAALARALELTPPDGLCVVAGSIYLIGEIRAAILGITPDPIIAL
ncbi:bifunctional folylpolyglutamate synthase/dihydrofolate synthase [Chondromyces apiculatus]|uniref:Dihydrofolate synthase/folylpolyglutamate synthase n=1 Tax=Chondromyces apiculatus DSM 436 TaxID=1192034 RepID=A0A017SUY0_9BACT|nr:Mur ligase family protein [Chondromyces apiculatus]EYF00794.1 Dihydrofolate synthase [Chondromyces apiculatus DSM 436]